MSSDFSEVGLIAVESRLYIYIIHELAHVKSP